MEGILAGLLMALLFTPVGWAVLYAVFKSATK